MITIFTVIDFVAATNMVPLDFFCFSLGVASGHLLLLLDEMSDVGFGGETAIDQVVDDMNAVLER